MHSQCLREIKWALGELFSASSRHMFRKCLVGTLPQVASDTACHARLVASTVPSYQVQPGRRQWRAPLGLTCGLGVMVPAVMSFLCQLTCTPRIVDGVAMLPACVCSWHVTAGVGGQYTHWVMLCNPRAAVPCAFRAIMTQEQSHHASAHMTASCSPAVQPPPHKSRLRSWEMPDTPYGQAAARVCVQGCHRARGAGVPACGRLQQCAILWPGLREALAPTPCTRFTSSLDGRQAFGRVGIASAGSTECNRHHDYESSWVRHDAVTTRRDNRVSRD